MRYKITVLPYNKIVYALRDELLYDVLIKNGFKINAPCGGNGVCGKCRVVSVGKNGENAGYLYTCKTRVDSDITILLDGVGGSGLEVFESGDPIGEKSGLGIALDIGTTTVVACLVDLKSGSILGKRSCLNPQASLGADVITRIRMCQNGKLDVLQKQILETTKELVDLLAGKRRIRELCVCGNPTMLHLFLGVSPESIGIAPFTPVFTQTKRLNGSELGLNVDNVVLLPSASAFIGSDVTAGVLACGMVDKLSTSLLVDVGTNGEVVMFANNVLYATSTAAGPALEGACIECGMGGVDGAIDKVSAQNGELIFSTVGNKPPKGICGSGLVDVVALLVKEGIIDESGAFDEDCESLLSKNLVSDRFYITDDVYLSQKDVRQFQLAKSAITSGIKTLLYENNVPIEDVHTLYLAGGLGYYTDVKNAGVVGLLPSDLVSKVQSVGNSGLSGTVKCLLKDECVKKVEQIASGINVVELAQSKCFMEEFVDNMSF